MCTCVCVGLGGNIIYKSGIIAGSNNNNNNNKIHVAAAWSFCGVGVASYLKGLCVLNSYHHLH